MTFYDGYGQTIALEQGTAGTASGVTLKAPWDTVIHRGWVSGAKENTLPAFWLT